ncbi:hypothetical protein V8G54_033138 [Vigna mungo]|uniref:Retrotransposon gag domain-containing protein n=1 Tax=Vigna mungo TaxID=3915 RepID=A0AAQ3MNF0_VIGMU
MQQKHAEEIAVLKAELGHRDQYTQHLASTVHRNQHRENENHDRQASQHTNPNTVRLTKLLPFTMTIMQTPMPENSPPVLEKYDGSGDPDNHLRIFSNAMVLYTNSDPVICRAFSLSLKDETLEWYNTLPPNSVDCFATVETLFRRQYSSNRKQEITPAELMNTKQEKGETLKAFMKRYTETARQVKNAHPPKTMDELQERVAEFIRMEDMRISQRKRQQEADVCGGRKDGKRPFDNNDKSGELPRTFKFDHFTVLNAPRAKVLEEALNVELRTLRRKPSPRNADEMKSCHFHQNHGHTTEECVTLKNQIENLIQAGHLRKYIKEGRGSFPGRDICREVPNGPIGRINKGGAIVVVSVAIVNDRFEELSNEERHTKFY